MEILNVGFWELILILLVALIVLGPENMTKTARSLGRTISRFTKSPMWATLRDTTREIRDLPTRIVREAALEESLAEINQESRRLTGELNQSLRQTGKLPDEDLDEDLNVRRIGPMGAVAFKAPDQRQADARKPDERHPAETGRPADPGDAEKGAAGAGKENAEEMEPAGSVPEGDKPGPLIETIPPNPEELGKAIPGRKHPVRLPEVPVEIPPPDAETDRLLPDEEEDIEVPPYRADPPDPKDR